MGIWYDVSCEREEGHIREGLLLLLLLSRFSRVRLCATPETAAHQAPPSLGFSITEKTRNGVHLGAAPQEKG